MGTSSSQPAKAPDFTERVAGYQYCCAFSPQGTYCAFGGADRRMRLVARRPGMIGHDDEMRVTPVPGTVEWCGYTVEGVLLATVFNSADSSKQLLAWGTPARGNFQGQLLTSAAISLHPTLPAELAGPITMSRDRSMLAVVAVTGENGSTVYTVRISKVKFAGEHLLYLPFLFAAGTFPAPVDSLSFAGSAQYLIISSGGNLYVVDLRLLASQTNAEGNKANGTGSPMTPDSSSNSAANGAQHKRKSSRSMLGLGPAVKAKEEKEGAMKLLRSTNDGWSMFFAASPDGSMLVTWEAPPKKSNGGRTTSLNPLTDSLSENSGPVTESRVRRFHLWSLDRNVAMVPVATLESCAQVHCAAISTDNAWLGVGAGIKYGTRKNRKGHLQMYRMGDDTDAGRHSPADINERPGVSAELTHMKEYPGAVNSLKFVSEISTRSNLSWATFPSLAVASDGNALATGEISVISSFCHASTEGSVLDPILCG